MTQSQTTPAQSSPVVVEILVNVPQEFAFQAFTKQGAWWPMASHHIGSQTPVDVVIEPESGGRWYEKAPDGTECLWGEVLSYDPFSRLLLGWHLNAKWEYDPELVTELEITFTPVGPESTQVKLEHRNMEKYGPDEGAVTRAFNSEQGWPGLLKMFAQKAS